MKRTCAGVARELGERQNLVIVLTAQQDHVDLQRRVSLVLPRPSHDTSRGRPARIAAKRSGISESQLMSLAEARLARFRRGAPTRFRSCERDVLEPRSLKPAPGHQSLRRGFATVRRTASTPAWHLGETKDLVKAQHSSRSMKVMPSSACSNASQLHDRLLRSADRCDRP